MLQIALNVSDFFTMVEENFEIQSFQMLQFDSKRKWFLYRSWRKFWNSVLLNAANLLKNASDFFTMVEDNPGIQSLLNAPNCLNNVCNSTTMTW